MVSKASDDLPEPLNPVMTTNLSRGMERLKFFKLCWRAPPIFMNFPAMTQNFAIRPSDNSTRTHPKRKPPSNMGGKVARLAHEGKPPASSPSPPHRTNPRQRHFIFSSSNQKALARDAGLSDDGLQGADSDCAM